MSVGMPPISVTLEGVPEFLARIPDAAKRLQVSKYILHNLGMLVKAEAMRKAPSRTGNLRRSILLRTDPSGNFATISTVARYAPFVESGTGLYGPKGQVIKRPGGGPFAWPIGISVKGGVGSVVPNRASGSPRAGTFQGLQYSMTIKGMHPHPFMRPGLDAALPHVPEVLAEAGKLLITAGAVPVV